MCLGDINVNFLNLSYPVTEYFVGYGFSQVINKPTRVTTTTATLRDPIYVSDPKIVVGSRVTDANGVQIINLQLVN